MRVMSWNVWWLFGPDAERRQTAIAATLEKLRPDLVGLQESYEGQATELARRLGMYAAFADAPLPPALAPPESSLQDEDLGVTALSRWPISAAGRHVLPAVHRPEKPVALLTTVEHPAGPIHFCVSCTEWEPKYADDHLAQTQEIAKVVGELPQPVILAADLNAPPASAEMAPLLRVMADTWLGEDVPTLSSRHPHAPLEAVKQIDQRIDYVLVRGDFTVERTFLADQPVDGLYPSDHFGVVTDLVFPAT